MQINKKFTSNLKRAGAAIEDSRTLLQHWSDAFSETEMKEKLIIENVTGKNSYRRRKDLLDFIFVPRYIRAYPDGHWKYLQQLEKAKVPIEIIRPIMYFYCALNEPFIPLIIEKYLKPRFKNGILDLSTQDVVSFIQIQIDSDKVDVSWTDIVLRGVAAGLLNALTGFGILQGKVKKKIAPVFIPIQIFYYIAFFLNKQEGVAGKKLLTHPYWDLFLLNDVEIQHLFMEAHQQKYLRYNELGTMIRVEFFEKSFEEAIDVVIERST